LEQIIAEPKCLKQLFADKTKPKNRSEAEIAGYKDVLKTIHQSAREISLSTNVIKQFHRDMMRYTDRPGGDWKSVNNKIIEQTKESYYETLEESSHSWHSQNHNKEG